MIQPFDDGGKFDKRFGDVFEPAIKDAGLDPYRVDRDPGVQVPIESIEQNIRAASICLCDITTDSPNVWYELGYAFATGRPVVMVCSDERVPRHKYPFDIQHRTIIPYQAESPRDFVQLRENITKRLKAQLSGSDALEAIRTDEQIAPVQGLSQPELAVIVSIAGNAPMPNDNVSAFTVRNEVEKAGFTPIAFGLGMKRLCAKGFVQVVETEDFDNRTIQVVSLTLPGWRWIEANEDKFILKREPQAAISRAQRIRTTQKTTEDEIDF